MVFTPLEIKETVDMFLRYKLDIRAITLGISLFDCVAASGEATRKRIRDKILRVAGNLVKVGKDIEVEFGIPIINKRISVTPIALIAGASEEKDYTPYALTLDEVTKELGIDFVGGFSALVQKGISRGDQILLDSIPSALAQTERVCSSVNVATTRSGINMDAVRQMGHIIQKTAQLTAQHDGIGCAKLVVFCNSPEDNPFMAGAFHGPGEGEASLNVGVSGPGVVKAALEQYRGASFDEIAEVIKKTAFKITRMGQLVGMEAARRLGVPFGILDLSLAPTPAVGDSVARILEEMGLESAGTHGTTAALALLTDMVKKGGVMASTHVGGLSGAFIPVSEDEGMVAAVQRGSLFLDKLEAMTCVCSVGLDMIAIPGDTSAATISAIIADEMAIGMVNNKTTAVRIIPVPGKKAGDWAEFGGLLGGAPVMPVHPFSSDAFIARGGRIPAPIH
ncbi:MAG TPA: PFL family protein, partial [Termitinemataceae bacterium]|nr:PFL family protein [Termitinemataceae bacterium]HPQ00086.1 PFL family protein [Termitinemataceae bacterium]